MPYVLSKVSKYRMIAIGATLALSGCNSPPETVAETPERKAGVAAPIDPSVYKPYQKNGWPKLFAAWGEKGVKRIQSLREAAAENIARNPACDAVENSDISVTRSTPPNEPVVFVHCVNGEKFYLSEQDVGSVLSSEMEKGKRFSGAELIRQCTDSVKARLSLPATFDQSMFSVSERQGLSGNRIVEFDFEAKNRLGLSLPAKAQCIMTTEGKFEVTISE